MKILPLSLVAMARSMDIDDIDTVVSELESDGKLTFLCKSSLK